MWEQYDGDIRNYKRLTQSNMENDQVRSTATLILKLICCNNHITRLSIGCTRRPLRPTKMFRHQLVASSDFLAFALKLNDEFQLDRPIDHI